jgi:hypothetical protein
MITYDCQSIEEKILDNLLILKQETRGRGRSKEFYQHFSLKAQQEFKLSEALSLFLSILLSSDFCFIHI